MRRATVVGSCCAACAARSSRWNGSSFAGMRLNFSAQPPFGFHDMEQGPLQGISTAQPEEEPWNRRRDPDVATDLLQEPWACRLTGGDGDDGPGWGEAELKKHEAERAPEASSGQRPTADSREGRCKGWSGVERYDEAGRTRGREREQIGGLITGGRKTSTQYSAVNDKHCRLSFHCFAESRCSCDHQIGPLAVPGRLDIDAACPPSIARLRRCVQQRNRARRLRKH